MRQAFVRQLLEAAKNDPDIILITGDLGYGVLDEFAQSLPAQFMNAGVAEQTMARVAEQESIHLQYWQFLDIEMFRTDQK